MVERAHVTELDALKAFRSRLIIYISQARPTLEEVSADVMRTRLWLQTDQRTYWDREVRKRRKKLEEAQQTLFGARLGSLQEVTQTQTNAVRKAKEALEEAEAKQRTIRQWDRQFDSQVEPLSHQLDRLHSFLTNDLAKAVHYLTEITKTLDEYSGIAANLGGVTASSGSGGGASGESPATGDASKPKGDA